MTISYGKSSLHAKFPFGYLGATSYCDETYDFISLPYSLRAKSILNFDFSINNENKEIYDKIVEYGRHLESDDIAPSHGIFLLGDVGIGKTHLCSTLFITALRFADNAKFVGQVELSRIIRSVNSFSGGSKKEYETCMECTVLMIDDLGYGVSSQSKELVQEHMFELMNARISDRKLTFMTTNLSFESLEEILGIPTIDRISEICQAMVITGKSFRKNGGRT